MHTDLIVSEAKTAYHNKLMTQNNWTR